MHVLITDSGVGGLSVCAYAEEFLRSNGTTGSSRLTYVNASAENGFGYNALDTRAEKLEHFDRFLHIVAEKYKPDLICVACNSLSVLLQDTDFYDKGLIPVHGIVKTGINHLLRDLAGSPGQPLIIFGTVTTIHEQTYLSLLTRQGVPGDCIISQACPDLADTISEDLSGLQAAKEIERYVHAALGKLQSPADTCLAYLACTHYGYRKELFRSAFEKAGVQAAILNPNEFVIKDLFGTREDHHPASAVEVEVVARYRIPEAALQTVGDFLNGISPKTVKAFRNYTYAPDLFPGFRPGDTAFI